MEAETFKVVQFLTEIGKQFVTFPYSSCCIFNRLWYYVITISNDLYNNILSISASQVNTTKHLLPD